MQNIEVPVKAVRGATSVPEDSEAAIISSTVELLEEILERNELEAGRIISIVFTATSDVTMAFPAKAARQMGLERIPLLCCRELDIEGMLPLCIRVLVHAWLPERQAEHVYLHDAVGLREDLTQ